MWQNATRNLIIKWERNMQEGAINRNRKKKRRKLESKISVEQDANNMQQDDKTTDEISKGFGMDLDPLPDEKSGLPENNRLETLSGKDLEESAVMAQKIGSIFDEAKFQILLYNGHVNNGKNSKDLENLLKCVLEDNIYGEKGFSRKDPSLKPLGELSATTAIDSKFHTLHFSCDDPKVFTPGVVENINKQVLTILKRNPLLEKDKIVLETYPIYL